MKKTELKIMIREIVGEEVRLELRSYLKEYKQKQVKTVERSIEKKQVKRPAQRYSKNSMLNEILNETANEEDWKMLGGKTFNTDSMSSILSNKYEQQSAETTAESMGLDSSQVPDHITNALNKDYRGLMKVIDKKKNGTAV